MCSTNKSKTACGSNRRYEQFTAHFNTKVKAFKIAIAGLTERNICKGLSRSNG